MSGPGHLTVDGQPPALGRTATGDDAWHWNRAYEDALKALRSFPDPAEFVLWLNERHREGLRTAWRSCEGWRVQPQYVREFRLMGLVEVSGNPHHPEANTDTRNHLSGFGMQVRRVVLAAEVVE